MTTYTAVIWAEESDGVFRNVVAVHDDAGGPLICRATLPDTFTGHPDAPGGVESAAELVLAENGWQVESWNATESGRSLYASAERI
jgi:hypothetical protein